ncbi:hypothetical protein ACFV2H_14515 [Streptomyces sp. NPDC059629]|uniref:hypothetical protein n=1 Tax=Streptomyces sp. NPDC059629 TaxID=3346889 RepID=UPI0036782722
MQEYGFPVKRIPAAQWRRELPRSAEVAATTVAFFDSFDSFPSFPDDGDDGAVGEEEPELGLGHVRADNVLRGLEGTGIVCPRADRALVFRYLDHCVENGILPPPARGDV